MEDTEEEEQENEETGADILLVLLIMAVTLTKQELQHLGMVSHHLEVVVVVLVINYSQQEMADLVL